MWQGSALSMLHIIEQGACRTNGDFKASTAKAIQVVSIELFSERIKGRIKIKLPRA